MKLGPSPHTKYKKYTDEERYIPHDDVQNIQMHNNIVIPLGKIFFFE